MLFLGHQLLIPWEYFFLVHAFFHSVLAQVEHTWSKKNNNNTMLMWQSELLPEPRVRLSLGDFQSICTPKFERSMLPSPACQQPVTGQHLGTWQSFFLFPNSLLAAWNMMTGSFIHNCFFCQVALPRDLVMDSGEAGKEEGNCQPERILRVGQSCALPPSSVSV